MKSNNSTGISDTMIDTMMYNIYLLYNANRCLKKIIVKEEDDQKLVEAEFFLFGNINKCTCILDADNEIISSHCDCKWHNDYPSCPHIRVAYEKSININKLPYDYEDPYFNDMNDQVPDFQNIVKIRKLEQESIETMNLINEAKDKTRNFNKISLQGYDYEIEPVLSPHSKNCFVAFKIGKKEKYYIKSLPEFLTNLEKNEEASYGKLLQFFHDENCFTDFSKKLIAFIRKYYYFLKLDEIKNPKTILLQGKVLDQFYTLLDTGKECGVTIKLDTLNHVFDLNVEKNDHLYIFSLMEKDCYYFGETCIYQVKQKQGDIMFYKIPLDKKGITCELIKKLKQDKLVVQQKDYAQFYQHILSIALPFINVTLPE